MGESSTDLSYILETSLFLEFSTSKPFLHYWRMLFTLTLTKLTSLAL